jgi:uncharacterized RDD family membrane protein YckC
MALRRLIDRPLHVDPACVGLALASPSRRVMAFVLDWMVVLPPTVLVSLSLAGLFLYMSDRPAFDALWSLKASGASSAAARHARLRDLAPLLVRMESRGLPASVVEAVEAGERDRAADLLEGRDFILALNLGEGGEAPLPAKSVRIAIQDLIPPVVRGIGIFCVPALYFTLFTCSRVRATPGKWLLRLRVIRLDGERLTLLEGLERFVGYLHIPGTMFVSVLDLWRDPNRRLPHDRVVHTAVVRRIPAARPDPGPTRAATA